MQERRNSIHAIILLAVAIAILGGFAAWAASKSVDLDGKSTNGAESSVSLTVLSTFPAKIENKVTNKAIGDTFSFNWLSAGPGGFASSLGAGTSTGVGVKWTWQTSQTVYSFTGNACTNDICFNKTGGPDPVTARGPFAVPGRSLTASGVTLSNASLSSSLLAFFSPPKVLFQVTSIVGPTSGSSVGYTTAVNNTSPTTVTLDIPAYPPGCCNDVHQLNCDGSCVYYLTDPLNCGACGNQCAAGSACYDGVCVAACPAGTTLCGETCVDLLNDPLNCGACGNACGDNQICTSGACFSCRPPEGTACDNHCVNIRTDSQNCGGCGINCNDLCPSTGQGTCSQGKSCTCVPGAGGLFSPPQVGEVIEAPLCESQRIQETLVPGATFKECRNSSVLAKEVANTVAICDGGNVPGTDGLCDNGAPPSVGTYRVLLPDLTKPIQPITITPSWLQLFDASGDGLPQPGEPAGLKFYVVNAGASNLTNVLATFSCPAVDLVDDGVDLPVGIGVTNATRSYPNIPGTPGTSGDCNSPPPTFTPVGNALQFDLSVAANHPGETTHPCNLHFTGSTSGGPFTQDVPVTVGIGGQCDPTNVQGDFDGLVGLDSPMAKLVPEEDLITPFPAKAFQQGKTRPMRLKVFCGTLNLDDSLTDLPQIVGLSEATHGTIDITKINLNDEANPFDPFFKYIPQTQSWGYQTRTKGLAKGTYTIFIRIANKKIYKAGFVLN
ncbi:MAG TPA: hypothetical protein VGR38_05140 [Candidatus Polarisedimenticolia bacterium]|nr:hypothetical protein [Candidatus Polarisedimenticolia bacterium]